MKLRTRTVPLLPRCGFVNERVLQVHVSGFAQSELDVPRPGTARELDVPLPARLPAVKQGHEALSLNLAKVLAKQHGAGIV